MMPTIPQFADLSPTGAARVAAIYENERDATARNRTEALERQVKQYDRATRVGDHVVAAKVEQHLVSILNPAGETIAYAAGGSPPTAMAMAELISTQINEARAVQDDIVTRSP